MKKTLAIILSCLLIVGVVFAMAISSAADGADAPAELFATTVQVHLPDGADEDDLEDIAFLGRQPLYEDAEKPTTITGYSTTDVKNSLTVGEGTLVLDPATGTVTTTNVTGIHALKCYTGSMTLVVKGTNTFNVASGNNVQVDFYQAANAEAGTPEYRGNLVIKGDGILNANSAGYNICSNSGALAIIGDVTLNAESTTNEAIHVAVKNNNLSDLVIGGNAKVNIVSKNNGIRMANNGKFIVKDNAKIDINCLEMPKWKAAVMVNGFEMISGTLDIDVASGSATEITGLNVQTGAAKFIGGKVNVSVTHTNASFNRAYGLFFKNNTDVTFSGTEVFVNTKQGKVGDANAVIGIQGTTKVINIIGGKISFTSDKFTAGFFGVNVEGCAVNISGGEISGTANSFVYSQGANCTLNITCGTFDVTSITSNYTQSSAKTFTQTAAANTSAYAAKYVVDPAGKTFKVTGIAAPANVKAGTVTKDDAPLTWDAVTDAAGYNVYANGKLLNEELITTNSWTAPVMPNTDYEIVVAAVNPLGGEVAAAAITFKTPDGVSSRVVPNAPTGLLLNGANDAKAIISWNAVDGADGYNVYVDDVKVNEAVITDTIYAISALEAGKEVSVTVVAVNMVGESEEATAIKVAPVVSDKASLLEVTLADGTLVALGSGKTSVNGATGTVVFDAATGIATVTDLTGVRTLSATKTLTVVFKGTSTIGTDAAENVLCADNLIVDGDGIVTVDANKATYPIIGQANVTFHGSVKMTVKAPNSSSTIHAARMGGDCTILIKDNVVLDIDGKGRALNAAGEKAAVIITDKADVTIAANADAIQAIADKDNADFTGTPGAYVEVSGNSKLLVTKGNCGIRCSYAMQDAGLLETNGSSQVVFKDNALIDITAPGQTVYVVDAAGTTNKGVNAATFTLTGNAHAKLTNNGPASNGNYYAALHLNSDANALNIDGGSLELIVSDKSTLGAYKVEGRATYNFKGYKSFVGGADAETAADITAFTSAPKYIKIAFTNPPTSDVSVSAVASAVALAVMMGLAVVVLRKKAHN